MATKTTKKTAEAKKQATRKTIKVTSPSQINIEDTEAQKVEDETKLNVSTEGMEDESISLMIDDDGKKTEMVGVTGEAQQEDNYYDTLKEIVDVKDKFEQSQSEFVKKLDNVKQEEQGAEKAVEELIEKEIKKTSDMISRLKNKRMTAYWNGSTIF